MALRVRLKITFIHLFSVALGLLIPGLESMLLFMRQLGMPLRVNALLLLIIRGVSSQSSQ